MSERRPTVAFDVIGTLFSLDRPAEELTRLGAPALAVSLLLADTLRDAYAWAHAGQYRPLRDVLEASLARLLRRLGIEAGDGERARVMRAFGELDPAPGAHEACGMLSAAGWRVLSLTNGSEESTRTLLTRAGLAERFDAMLSCDLVRTTKPHPKVYELAKERADGELWLVAAHAWDVAGASVAGLRTAWVSSLEEEYLGVYPEPDVVAGDLAEAATRVLGHQRG